MKNCYHRIIVNNREVKRFYMLADAIEYRNELKRLGIWADINTQLY